MSTAIVIQERRISIPDCALFSPSELTIASNCSEADFVRIVKAVSAIDNAGDLWVADAALFAIKKWGKKKGIEIAVSATAYKKITLEKYARIAEAFPPEKRFTGYNFSAYMYMSFFAQPFRDEFLARNAGRNLSAHKLRALAVAEVGEPVKEPHKRKKRCFLRADLHARLLLHTHSERVSVLVNKILEEWLRTQPDVPAPDVIPAPPVEPESRPTYAQRREQQLADGAQPIMKKPVKKITGKLRRQWTECNGPEFLDAEGGPEIIYNKSGSQPHKFYSEAEAIAAEADFFTASGFHEMVVQCDVCSKSSRREIWHVKHRFSSQERVITAQ